MYFYIQTSTIHIRLIFNCSLEKVNASIVACPTCNLVSVRVRVTCIVHRASLSQCVHYNCIDTFARKVCIYWRFVRKKKIQLKEKFDLNDDVKLMCSRVHCIWDEKCFCNNFELNNCKTWFRTFPKLIIFHYLWLYWQNYKTCL